LSKKKKKRITDTKVKELIKSGEIKPTKICDACGLEKKLRYFQEDKRNKDFFKPTCKECTEKQKKEQIPKGYVAPEKYRVPLKTEFDVDDKKLLSERFSTALLQQFGNNLETLVTYLTEVLNNAATTPTLKLSIVNFIADRTMGKPLQTQIIEQKVIQVTINKPDLTSIDITPKE